MHVESVGLVRTVNVMENKWKCVVVTVVDENVVVVGRNRNIC